MNSYSSHDPLLSATREDTVNSLSSFPALCLETRLWERKHIPFASPQIALDIALYATAAKFEQQAIASKTVHLTVGYSPDRVREVLIEMVAEGWITKVPHHSDGRIRLIEASDKLIELMQQYEQVKKYYFSRLEPRHCQLSGVDPAPAK